jgi:hypothetical protein
VFLELSAIPDRFCRVAATDGSLRGQVGHQMPDTSYLENAHAFQAVKLLQKTVCEPPSGTRSNL